MEEIIVIGGGLAGTEAALQIAKRKIKVKLYEMKPNKFSEAHTNKNLAEIVCSNSYKSNLLTNACGLLKEELRQLGSFLIPIADSVNVPAGQALAVDREQFAKLVTDKINEIPELEREGYIRSVHAIKSWADTMEYNINNKVKEINYGKNL